MKISANWLGGALLALCSILPAHAELLVSENFSYPAGDLYAEGRPWLRGTAASNTDQIKVVAGGLTYSGYQDQAVGNSVQLSSTGVTANQNYALKAAESGITSGKIYASFLFKVTSTEGLKGNPMIASFSGANKNGYTDHNASLSQIGRVHLRPSATTGSTTNFRIAYSKNTGVANLSDSYTYGTELEVGTTYLIVMSYEFKSSTKDDVFSIWVSPAASQTEPQATFSDYNAADVSATYGQQGIRLYQYASGSNQISTVLIDAVRVATTWADLFGEQGGEDPTPGAKITPSVTEVAINGPEGYLMQHLTATATLNVKATGLTEDIAVESAVEGLTVTPATISKDEACSEQGATLSLSYTATAATPLNGKLTLKSAGAADVDVALSSYVIPVKDETRFAALSLVENETYEYYRYTGSMAKVSYVDVGNKDIYIQDMTGAIRVTYSNRDLTACPFKAGDKVKNLYLCRVDDVRGPCFMALTDAVGDVTSSDNEITPSEITFSALASSPEEYLYRLVTIKDVTIAASQGATWSTAGFAATDAAGAGRVRTFAGTDLVGVEAPAFAPAVTGISTSRNAAIVTLRSAADLTAAAPELEITKAVSINPSAYQTVGTEVEFGTFTVKATALAKPCSIWLSGKDAAQFALDREEIPAGTGIYVVKVTYKPTATGSHSAMVTFDATPTELSASYSISARAYDPANPPVITVDASALTPFTAKVGETHKQTITYTTKNFLDYGSVKVETPGAFILSSTSMLKTDGTYTVDVTFSPKSEGSFTNKIIFSTDMAEPVEVVVTGSTTGGQEPEAKQGDELAFEGPALKYYATDFTNAVQTNKPLSLQGWKNVAAQGTRAWWSYTEDGGNQVAKVSGYDFLSTETTPCQMLLLSPRLDFANAETRLLCFNIKGDFMTEGMQSRLDVAVVDAKAAEANPEAAVFEVVSGLNIPCTSDENGEWARYVLDVDAWELPDEFYVAFVFTSTRGKEEPCVYYVDDFSWGRSDVPFIRTSHQLVELATVAGQSVTSEAITATGFNLSEPIALSISGSDAKCFTLSTDQLPAGGDTFTVDFVSDEVREHTALVSMKSGSDALTYVMLSANTDPAGIHGITAEAAAWGDSVTVSDLAGRVLLTNATAADALNFMKQSRGQLFIVVAADGTAYKYIAK